MSSEVGEVGEVGRVPSDCVIDFWMGVIERLNAKSVKKRNAEKDVGDDTVVILPLDDTGRSILRSAIASMHEDSDTLYGLYSSVRGYLFDGCLIDEEYGIQYSMLRFFKSLFTKMNKLSIKEYMPDRVHTIVNFKIDPQRLKNLLDSVEELAWTCCSLNSNEFYLRLVPIVWAANIASPSVFSKYFPR